MGLFGFLSQGVSSIAKNVGSSLVKSATSAVRTMGNSLIGAGQSYINRAISQGASYLVGKASNALRTNTFLDPFIQEALYSAAGSVFGDVSRYASSQSLTNAFNKFMSQGINQPYSAQISSVPGLANQTGRYVFGNMEVKGYLRYEPMEYSGYDTDIQGSVPPEYLVIIRNSRNKVIRGVMQEGFVMGANSKWSPLVPQNLSNIVNMTTQAVTGKAFVGKWATRRIWTGTSPISMNINLMFNAVNDEYTEVVLPCLRLQQMAMPSIPRITGSGTLEKYLPLMSPPGPSPFAEAESVRTNFTAVGSSVGYENLFLGQGDKIQIKIGKFLMFSNVIISQVSVNYANKMTQMGYPIQSIANVVFETYEMMTLEDLEEAHVIKGSM